MGKLVVTEYISMDGVFEEPGRWSFPFFSEDAGQFKDQELKASDAQLLGRVTYEGFAKAWPTMEGTGDFGVKMNTMPKYLVSTTVDSGDWGPTTVINDNVPEQVARLKEKYTGDILVAGSGQLLETLIEHDLVDEYRFMVHPIFVGSGKRLFQEGQPKKILKLIDTKVFASGITLLFYAPADEK